jgi:hypothetical protein
MNRIIVKYRGLRSGLLLCLIILEVGLIEINNSMLELRKYIP